MSLNCDTTFLSNHVNNVMIFSLMTCVDNDMFAAVLFYIDYENRYIWT